MSRKSFFRPAADRRAAAARTVKGRTARSLFRGSLRFEPLEDRRLLALVAVTTVADTIDFNDGLTSLREAIFATNLVSGADEIRFDPSLTANGPATILLTQGELKITDDLTIAGPGADLLTIDASGNDPTPSTNEGNGSRIFTIDDGNLDSLITVSIAGVTLTGADISQSRPVSGGGITNHEYLTLESVSVVGNAASAIDQNSAAVFSSGGNLEVRSSNVAANFGQGIAVRDGNLTVVDSIVSGNYFRGVGVRQNPSITYGGISIQRGDAVLDHTTVSGHDGGFGVASKDGSLMILTSTVSGNLSGVGASGRLTIQDSTVSENRLTQGRPSFVGIGVRATGDLHVENSDISDNLGTGIVHESGNLTALASTINRNTARSSGIADGILSLNSVVAIVDCEIS